MDNAVPPTPVGRRFFGPIAAIAQGVRHGVEDMPQERFRKNKAVCTLVIDDQDIQGRRWDSNRFLWYHIIRS